MSRISTILFLLIFHLSSIADTEVPKVYHYDEKTYQSLSQNWDISQGPDGRMHFGNSGGLLSFDGYRWHNRTTSFSKTVRAVHADEKGRIYVGGFASIGYWYVNEKCEEEFVSLTGSLSESQISDEEIWHILPVSDGILFQSFSTIFKYNFEKVEVLQPPGNIMFCQNINGRVVVPVIDKGLHELHPDGTFSFLSGSEVFAGKQVATILPLDKKRFLVGLQNEGIYVFENGSFAKWETPVNAELESLQLNKGLLLQNGDFVFGSILGGLFITDDKGQIRHHISQENGLQNNTVLALFEDEMNMLWVGLDKGVDLVDLDSPLLFFLDKSGLIGTVYTAALFEGYLYIGSNQGIFKKPFPSGNKAFELLPGSQGQVWHLQVFDGKLLGGHNSGTIEIEHGQLKFLNRESGGFTFARHPQKDEILLQGAYIGINVFQKNRAGEWGFSHRLEGFGTPVRELFFDARGQLWARHNRKGVARLTIDDDVTKVLAIDHLDVDDGLPTEFDLEIEKAGSEVYVQTPDELLHWDVDKQKLKEVQGYLASFSETDFGASPFLIYPNKIEWKEGGDNFILNVDLPKTNGCSVPLSAEYCLLCMEEGYALLPRLSKSSAAGQVKRKPLLTQITVNENGDKARQLLSPADSLVFRPAERHLRFYFAFPKFNGNLRLRSRLIGFDRDWTAFGMAANREFTNLPPGEYQFQIQAENIPEITSFPFSIEPQWFQTRPAKFAFFLLMVVFAWLLYRLHRLRLKRHTKKMKMENEKELYRQQTEAENRMLQNKVKNKSRKLADTTMNLVRKNQTLMKINEKLNHAQREKDESQLKKQLTRLTRMVEAHLESEEDWKVFEENFNQLHDQFFKRLKEQFPELTPGDFRLAAYLKMNLSSKEMAPLLNISVRGVENKRYRLRKKLGLESDDNLTEFFMQF